MTFYTGTVEYFENYGLDTTGWRKSVDGTKTIAHLELIIENIPNIASDIFNATKYEHPSTELDDLLNSSDWTPQEEGV